MRKFLKFPVKKSIHVWRLTSQMYVLSKPKIKYSNELTATHTKPIVTFQFLF